MSCAVTKVSAAPACMHSYLQTVCSLSSMPLPSPMHPHHHTSACNRNRHLRSTRVNSSCYTCSDCSGCIHPPDLLTICFVELKRWWCVACFSLIQIQGATPCFMPHVLIASLKSVCLLCAPWYVLCFVECPHHELNGCTGDTLECAAMHGRCMTPLPTVRPVLRSLSAPTDLVPLACLRFCANRHPKAAARSSLTSSTLLL